MTRATRASTGQECCRATEPKIFLVHWTLVFWSPGFTERSYGFWFVGVSMIRGDYSAVLLNFPLDIKADWPPVAIESKLFRKLPEAFQVQAVSLFIKNLSVDDIIALGLSDENIVRSWRHFSTLLELRYGCCD